MGTYPDRIGRDSGKFSSPIFRIQGGHHFGTVHQKVIFAVCAHGFHISVVACFDEVFEYDLRRIGRVGHGTVCDIPDQHVVVVGNRVAPRERDHIEFAVPKRIPGEVDVIAQAEVATGEGSREAEQQFCRGGGVGPAVHAESTPRPVHIAGDDPFLGSYYIGEPKDTAGDKRCARCICFFQGARRCTRAIIFIEKHLVFPFVGHEHVGAVHREAPLVIARCGHLRHQGTRGRRSVEPDRGTLEIQAVCHKFDGCGIRGCSRSLRDLVGYRVGKILHDVGAWRYRGPGRDSRDFRAQGLHVGSFQHVYGDGLGGLVNRHGYGPCHLEGRNDYLFGIQDFNRDRVRFLRYAILCGDNIGDRIAEIPGQPTGRRNRRPVGNRDRRRQLGDIGTKRNVYRDTGAADRTRSRWVGKRKAENGRLARKYGLFFTGIQHTDEQQQGCYIAKL